MNTPTYFDHDELLDIVNEQDEVIAQQYRSHVYAIGSRNFRVINAFITNDKGKLWIPRRSAHKKLFPLCLDASVGGHVKAGETYQEAFARELQEELNLDAATVFHELIGYLNPQNHNVSAHMQLYIVKYNQTPQYNTNDFASSAWFTIDEIQAAIAQGDRTKGDLPALINFIASIHDPR